MVRMDWTSYLMSGILAILLSWMTTACRFGNEVTPAENPDPITGYYLMRPQRVTLFVKLHTETSSRQGVHPAAQVPSPIGDIISNPAAAIFQDGLVFIGHSVPERQIDWLPTLLDEQLGLTTNGNGSPFIAWEEEKCLRQHFFQGSGLIHQDQSTSINGLNTRGRIELDLTFYHTFAGTETFDDCQTSLQAISECYQNSAACLGETQSEKEQMQTLQRERFEPYVDAGIIDLSDFIQIEAMGYEVSYE